MTGQIHIPVFQNSQLNPLRKISQILIDADRHEIGILVITIFRSDFVDQALAIYRFRSSVTAAFTALPVQDINQVAKDTRLRRGRRDSKVIHPAFTIV